MSTPTTTDTGRVGTDPRRDVGAACDASATEQTKQAGRTGTHAMTGNDAAHSPDPGAERERRRLLKTALDAAAFGLFVFPVRAGSKLPVFHGLKDCKGNGVCADGHQGWEQRATCDPAQIRRWWSKQPFNVGVACGPSGLLVVDLDTSGGQPLAEWGGATTGQEVLAQVAAAHGATVPDTYTVSTPTGGRHLYFRPPAELGLRNTQSQLGPWVDTRAGGGFVVAAGSVRPEGPYRVARHGVVEELPGWLAEMLTPPPPPEPRPSGPLDLPTGRANAYVAAILAGEADTVAAAPVGQRQSTLLASARTLGRLVGGGEVDEDNARAILLNAAGVHIGVDGMTHAEVERTIDRAIEYGKQLPRRVERGRGDTGAGER